MTAHAITWFEIPVRDLDRAQRFYEAVLAKPLRRETMGTERMAIFPSDDNGVGGCLNIGSERVAPSNWGSRVYLDAGPSIDAALQRAEAAGGFVATPKTALPPGLGFYAHIDDCEGNRVGLHSLA